MVTEQTVLRISGRLTFEHEITLGQAAQIIAFLDDPASAVSASPTPLTTNSGSLGARSRSSGPRDALESSGAKTNPEKIVALAHHVLQDGAKDTFTAEDIRAAFRRARESVPGNMSRDMDTAMKAGWIAESDTKGEFYVLDRASRVIEDGFASLKTARGSGGTKSRPVARRVRKSADVPEAFKDIDDISPKIDGVIDYHKLKTGPDKLLWAVFAAKQLGVPSVSNKDVAWLTDRLGSGIKSGEIAGCFRSKHKAGQLNRSTQDNTIRITPDGETYIKSKTTES
jgi:hypothetical protein